MTDKQIIVDGVDVSGCEFYDDGSCRECDMRVPFYSDIDCHDKCNKDCCYKQLKHKEQECERLRFPMQDTNYAILAKEEFEEYKKLKAENDELKKFQKLLEEQMKFNKSELELSLSSEIKRSEILLKEFKKVDKQRDTWREKAEKYFKTITEIKEIAEENDELLQGYHTEWANNKIILHKISECEVKREEI